MWQAFLQNNYNGRNEWLAYSDAYGLAEKLGFDSAEAAWDANPYITGSVDPADYGHAPELACHYANKMLEWTDDRLRFELTLRDNDSWATDATMKLWDAAMLAEVKRRGLTD